MGGSRNPEDSGAISYEVMAVNLKTGDVGQVEDTIYGINAPAAASSLNRIALCGGESSSRSLNYCQVYSPKYNKCVYLYIKQHQATTSNGQWLDTE